MCLWCAAQRQWFVPSLPVIATTHSPWIALGRFAVLSLHVNYTILSVPLVRTLSQQNQTCSASIGDIAARRFDRRSIYSYFFHNSEISIKLLTPPKYIQPTSVHLEAAVSSWLMYTASLNSTSNLCFPLIASKLLCNGPLCFAPVVLYAPRIVADCCTPGFTRWSPISRFACFFPFSFRIVSGSLHICWIYAASYAVSVCSIHQSHSIYLISWGPTFWRFFFVLYCNSWPV